jgi:hypothetical protein
MCNVLSEWIPYNYQGICHLLIYLTFSFSSHFTSEETTYPQGTCINRVQMKTAFVYYTQFTIDSTEIRQIAHYLTRSHRYTSI